MLSLPPLQFSLYTAARAVRPNEKRVEIIATCIARTILNRSMDVTVSDSCVPFLRTQKAKAGTPAKATAKRGSSSSSSTPKAKPKARVTSTGKAAPAKNAFAKKGGAKGKKGATEAVVKRTRQPSTVMWRVSDELAAVVGTKEATVDTIRTAVYQYIREHELQVCNRFLPLGDSGM